METQNCIITWPSTSPIADWLWRPDVSPGYPTLPLPERAPSGGWVTLPSLERPKNHTVSTLFNTTTGESTVTVRVKMPGYKKENIALHLDGTKLSVMAESDDSFIANFEEYMEVPESEPIKAEYSDGILSITLELKSKKKKILIS